MSINYLTIIFASVLIGVECRSVISPNISHGVEKLENYEASNEKIFHDIFAPEDFDYVVNLTNVNQGFVNRISKDFPVELSRLITTRGLSVEKLLAEIVAKTVNVTDQAGSTAQSLKQLKFIQDALSNINEIEESSIIKLDDIGKTESTVHDGNQNFILIGGNNWLDYLQEFLEEQYIDTEEDNDSYVNSSFNDSSTSYSLVDQISEEIDDDILDQSGSEQSDEMVAEFENDVSGIQKYFEKLCRKHRAAS